MYIILVYDIAEEKMEPKGSAVFLKSAKNILPIFKILFLRVL